MVYVIDLLAVVPSVVVGLWGLLVLAPNIAGVYGWLSDTFDGWPECSARSSGRTRRADRS